MSDNSDASALVVLYLAASAPGCGDLRDVQVPLLPEANPVVTPMFARVPAQAFVSIGIQSAGGVTDACPLSLALALGSSCDRISSGDGACGSLRDGGDARVQCSVRSDVDASGAYDIDLLLEHNRLPRFAVIGAMNDTEVLPVTLQATTLEGSTIDAQCVAEVFDIEPGSVRFRLGTCLGEVNGREAAGCEVNISAGFENCAR